MRRPPFLAAVLAFLTGCMMRSRSGSDSSGTNMMNGGSGNGMMGGGSNGMMNVSQHDVRTYMEMFDHHREIRRTVSQLPNGIRTVTESDNPRIAMLLHEHVPSMYRHVSEGNEVRCMSDSLPTMFRNAAQYNRHLQLTKTGVAVTETSGNPVVLAAIRRHAREVTGFVQEGMPALMHGMM
jgi:hypothetical protein